MKHLTKLTVAIAALIVSTVFVQTQAHADYLPEDKTAAEMVEGFDLMVEFPATETFVPSRIEFERLSADPVADLIKIASKSRYKSVMRSRAVQSLALYAGDDRALTAIDKLFVQVRPGKKLFPAVLVAYAQIHLEDAAEEIAALASHRRKEVRLAAIIALGRFGGQTGYDTLIELEQGEKDAQLKSRIKP